jgi:hypothetical protein
MFWGAGRPLPRSDQKNIGGCRIDRDRPRTWFRHFVSNDLEMFRIRFLNDGQRAMTPPSSTDLAKV